MKFRRLPPGKIIQYEGRAFMVKEVVEGDFDNLIVVAECLEKKAVEHTAVWNFPVDGKRGLRAFAKYSERILN